MFQPKNPLTNVRPKEDVAQFIVTPTVGVMKLTPKAAGLMGIVAEDYISVLPAEVTIDGEVVERLFAFKGRKGDKENGLNQVGSKCDLNGGNIQFSSSNAWKSLGGDTESNTKYKLHGAEEGDVAPNEFEGTTYYMLELIGKTAKIEKTKSEKGEGSADLGASNDMSAAD